MQTEAAESEKESRLQSGEWQTFSNEERDRYPTLGLRGLLRQEVRPQERYAIVGGFGILLLLAYATINPETISPIFPAAALVFFLYPFSRGIITRRLMQLGIATFLLWLGLSVAGVLFPFIIAFVFSYLMAPLVRRLAGLGIPRWLTSIAVVLLIVGAYSLVGFVLIPAFIGEFDQLSTSAQSLLAGADRLLDHDKLVAFIQQAGFSAEQAEELVTSQIEPQINAMISAGLDGTSDFLQNITQILEGLFGLILIPILSFYMTVDFNRMRAFMRTKVLRDDPRYVYYLRRVDGIVSAYMRGILLTSSLVGAAAVAIFSILGLPYAILLGVLTGIFNLIPTLGMFLNVGVGLIIFSIIPDGGFVYNTIVLVSTILGLHAMNAYLVEPRILGDRVGMHPVLVIASLFIFAKFLGFIGLLIAVPVTAIVLMFLREWYGRSTGQRTDGHREMPVRGPDPL